MLTPFQWLCFFGIFPTLQCKKAAFTVASIQCTNSCNLSQSLSTTTIGKTNITGTATNVGDIYLLLPSSFLDILRIRGNFSIFEVWCPRNRRNEQWVTSLSLATTWRPSSRPTWAEIAASCLLCTRYILKETVKFQWNILFQQFDNLLM